MKRVVVVLLVLLGILHQDFWWWNSIEPLVFHERGDGLWAVKESGSIFGSEVVFDGRRAPQGRDGAARVPEELEGLVLEAAEACPGECIFVEP